MLVIFFVIIVIVVVQHRRWRPVVIRDALAAGLVIIPGDGVFGEYPSPQELLFPAGDGRGDCVVIVDWWEHVRAPGRIIPPIICKWRLLLIFLLRFGRVASVLWYA